MPECCCTMHPPTLTPRATCRLRLNNLFNEDTWKAEISCDDGSRVHLQLSRAEALMSPQTPNQARQAINTDPSGRFRELLSNRNPLRSFISTALQTIPTQELKERFLCVMMLGADLNQIEGIILDNSLINHPKVTLAREWFERATGQYQGEAIELVEAARPAGPRTGS
jgi:hypothetical protein